MSHHSSSNLSLHKLRAFDFNEPVQMDFTLLLLTDLELELEHDDGV